MKAAESSPLRILCILDDWVLDVTDFADAHPGGAFMLKGMNGKDISKYFHGGYNIEPTKGGWNNAHSNYARTIVNSLIVAKVQDGECVVAEKTMSIQSQSNLTSGVSTFVLGNGDKGIGNAGQFGQHWLVQMKAEDGKLLGEARQYTVSRCMRPEVYKQYLALVEGKATEIDLGEDTDTITLTCKDYSPMTKTNSLSGVIHKGLDEKTLFNV